MKNMWYKEVSNFLKEYFVRQKIQFPDYGQNYN